MFVYISRQVGFQAFNTYSCVGVPDTEIAIIITEIKLCLKFVWFFYCSNSG